MPKKKLSQAQKRVERDRQLGFIIIEVVRATNEGRPNLNQQDVIGLIRKRWGGKKLSKSTMSNYVGRLKTKETGRIWLRSDSGQSLILKSEETLLKDSKSIKALFIATKLADNNQRFSTKPWIEKCKQSNGIAPETCEELLQQYSQCGYIVNGGATGAVAQLDTAAITIDMFYLRQARNAGLKSRPKRRPATSQ